MVRSLLIRGMLVGIVAGLLAFGFSRIFGEPQVDRAIAFEQQMAAAKAESHAATGMQPLPEEPELVSRSVQAGIGLFTGIVVYCTAFGGLFSLVFAVAIGRVGRLGLPLGPRAVAALLAGACFVAVYLVPSLKYPANPPSIGEPDTIGHRTALYFIMMLVSVVAMAGAVMLRERLARRHGGWTSALAAVGVYLALVAAAQILLPGIDEVPDDFPASLLWNFRMAALGTQAVMWVTIGLLFGWLTERAARAKRIISAPGAMPAFRR